MRGVSAESELAGPTTGAVREGEERSVVLQDGGCSGKPALEEL